MTNKKCPKVGLAFDCIEKRCAWWSASEGACAVLTIAIHLRLATIARSGPDW